MQHNLSIVGRRIVACVEDLAAHLEKLNQQAAADGFPIVKIVPLPRLVLPTAEPPF